MQIAGAFKISYPAGTVRGGISRTLVERYSFIRAFINADAALGALICVYDRLVVFELNRVDGASVNTRAASGALGAINFSCHELAVIASSLLDVIPSGLGRHNYYP